MADVRETETPSVAAPSALRSFGAEHECFARDFQRVREAAARLDPMAGLTMGRLGRRLRRHMRVEEASLLAPLEERVGTSTGSLTETLRTEHARLDDLIDAAIDAVSSGTGAGLEELDALELALRGHEQTEERLLLPLCDRVLTPEQRAAAARELDRKISGPPSVPERRA